MWLGFFLSAAVIVAAGSRLTHYADQLSDKLGIGKVWLGVLLLGFITSLPEAITSIFSVVSLQAADLAVGNMLGSNNFNIFLIVVMDILFRKGSVTNDIVPKPSHSMAAIFSIVLVSVIGVNILASVYGFGMELGMFSVGSIFAGVFYLFGMRKLFLGENCRKKGCDTVDAASCEYSLRKIYINLFASAFFVVLAAMFLAQSADNIATTTGLGRTFVGTLFLALATSLPELVVTISALRLGSLDLAVGNIFGSNMTNMFLIFICDFFYIKAPMLSSVSKTHVVTAGICVLMSFFALFGLRRKEKKVFLNLGSDSWILVGLFVGGSALLYYLR